MPPTYSVSSESTTSGTTSSTIWGPGTLTGRALVAFGNAALQAVESAVIHRRLQIITSFLSQSKDEVSHRSEQVYDDLLELCRRDLYSSSVRLQALSLVMVQIASMKTSNLVKALVKWPSLEITLFLSEIIKCVPLDRPGPHHDSRQVMHIKLEKLYMSSQSPGHNHNADPFMIFIGQLATTGEIGCEAIAESGLIDKLLSVFLDDSRSIQTSYRWLGSNNSTQLLGISILGCVDLHENITVAHDASDPESRRLLEDSRKSRIGSDNHLTIVPFITRTGVTLQTQSGTSNSIQVTINDISASLSRCRFAGSKSSLVWADHATNHTCRDCDQSSTRNIHDPSTSTSASPRREANQRTGNKLRRLKRAFSVGDRHQAGQFHTVSTHSAPSQSSNIASSSRLAGAEIAQAHPNSTGGSPKNGQPVSSNSSRSSSQGMWSTGNQRERLRRTVSDSHLRMSSRVQDRGRLSKCEPRPREGDGSQRVKRSYSAGAIRWDGDVVNISSTSNRFPIADSSSRAASTASEIGRVNVDYGSSTDDHESSSDSLGVFGRGLERRIRGVPQLLSSSPLQTNSILIPSASSNSANIQDRPCYSPQTGVLVSSPRLFRRGTSQRTGNRLQRLKRAFSLNDKQQSKRTDDIAASPPRPLPTTIPAVQSRCDAEATQASQDPSHHIPHVEDEILTNSPGPSNLAKKLTERGLKHLKRAFSTGDRQQEQRSTEKASRRLRRAFSMGDRRPAGANYLRRRGDTLNLTDSSETPPSLPLPSQANLLLSQQPQPPSSPIHVPTADHTANHSPSPDIENEKIILAQTTSQPSTTSFIDLPSYQLQPISDPTPTNGEDDVPPPYRDPSQQQADDISTHTSSVDPVTQTTSQQPPSIFTKPERTQHGLPPPYRGISPEQDADTIPPMECVPPGCPTHTAASRQTCLSSYNHQQPFVVFLQHRGVVKKVRIEATMSFSLLRELFLERFPVNFTLEGFPAIYINDPRSGVKYELEDVNDVKENSLISLDLNPLDEIKQHIDSQISILSQDIKTLQSVITVDRGQSTFSTSSTPSEALVRRPTVSRRIRDWHLRPHTRRLSTVVDDITVSLTQPPQS